MHLPHGGVLTVGHENFNVQEFLCEITCDKRTPIVEVMGVVLPVVQVAPKPLQFATPPFGTFIGLSPTPSSLGIKTKVEPV